MSRLWHCVAFLMAVATSGFSQDLAVGTRLRLTRANGERITGELAESGARTITLTQTVVRSGDRDHVVVSREDIQRLEISTETHRGRGAGIGLLSGAAIGAVVGYAAGGRGTQGIAAILLGTLLGGLGAGVGAVAAPGDTWEKIEPGHVGVSVIPVRRGAAIAVALRF